MHDNDQIAAHYDHDNRDDLVWKPFWAIFWSVVIVIIGLMGLFAPSFLPEIILLLIRVAFIFALPFVSLPIWLFRRVRGKRMSWDILITGLAGLVFTVCFWIQWLV
jgi:hypothetical protein